MVQNLSSFDAALKEFYEGAIRETLNNDVMAFKTLDESDREWSGRHVRFPVHTSRNNGVGGRGESGTLPTAGNQSYAESRISATYQYGRLTLTGQVLAAGKNAFADAMAVEMSGLTTDLVNDAAKQVWGVGDGRLAQVGAAAASATQITVYNRFFEPGQPGARFLGSGQSIDIGTVAAPTSLCSSQIISTIGISQNPATNTDSINVTASTLNGSQCESFIFNRGAGGAGIEMQGIRSLVDNYTESNIWGSNAYFGATIQNISRATVTNWNSLILSNSGVERILVDKIHSESGLEADCIWGHHDVIRAFQESVAADRRYSTTSFQVGVDGANGGKPSLSYNGVKMIKDRYAPYNELLIMKKDILKMYTLSNLKFADMDGAILNRVSNQDVWEAFVRYYKNLGIDGNPRGALFLRDIKVDL